MSLYLKQMEVGPMGNFVYLVGDAVKKEVMLVDPAWQIDTIFRAVEKEGLTLTGALVTHSHFDHCNGIEELLQRADLPIYVQKQETEFLKSVGGGLINDLFGVFPKEHVRTVSDGDKVRIGDVELTFIHTPGHTPGSQCFLVQDKLISGDTLFIRGCGRTDLPGGDPEQMYASLTQKLMRLPDRTILFPGHNYAEDAEQSPMSDEKKRNPYLACGDLDTFLSLTGGRRKRGL
jgi:glyoxylase-like metal-dependent hydrolase (beta-lactamase superfamily II)